MRLPSQSTGMRRNLPAVVRYSSRQVSGALMPAQMHIERRVLGPEPELDGGERITCRTCSQDGFQDCTLSTPGAPDFTFTRECTNCSACQVIAPVVQSGQPLPPLQFTQRCTRGGRQLPQRNCTRCSRETRIDLPWPASDRCIQFCCSGLDPTSCTVSVREC